MQAMAGTPTSAFRKVCLKLRSIMFRALGSRVLLNILHNLTERVQETSHHAEQRLAAAIQATEARLGMASQVAEARLASAIQAAPREAFARQLTMIEIATTPILTDASSRVERLVADAGLPMFNPAALDLGDEVIMVARRTTRILNNDGRCDNPDTPHDTINHMFRFDRNLTLLDHQPVDDSLLRRASQCSTSGFEDARLFLWRGAVWGLAAGVRDHGEAQPRSRQVLMRFEQARVVEFFEFTSPAGISLEKNWVPLVRGDDLFFIYNISHHIVFRFQDGGLVLHQGAHPANSDVPIRGSTNLIPVEGGYLGLAHVAPLRMDSKTFYRHLFIVYDEELRLISTSIPFFLQRRGIEFACGLVDRGEDILISYGVADRAAVYCLLPKRELRHWVALPDRPAR